MFEFWRNSDITAATHSSRPFHGPPFYKESKNISYSQKRISIMKQCASIMG
jgi:hypothetical protein